MARPIIYNRIQIQAARILPRAVAQSVYLDLRLRDKIDVRDSNNLVIVSDGIEPESEALREGAVRIVKHAGFRKKDGSLDARVPQNDCVREEDAVVGETEQSVAAADDCEVRIDAGERELECGVMSEGSSVVGIQVVALGICDAAPEQQKGGRLVFASCGGF